LAQFETEMAGKYGVAAGQRLDVDRIQAQLPADTAIIAWVDMHADHGPAAIVDEHWACIVKSQGPPLWTALPGQGKDGAWTAEDRNLASELKGVLGHWTGAQSAAWQQELIRQLHHQRLKPVEQHLAGVQRLIVLPAGKMAGVPLEVLTDAYTISYAPSGTMYAWLKESHRPRSTAGSGEKTRMLALGDPVFQQPEEEVRPLPDPPDHGVFVAMIAPDSNAFHSGIRSGDVMLSYGGTVLAGPQDLGPAIQQHLGDGASGEPSAEIAVSAWREGEIVELAVAPGRLGLQPAGQPASQVINTGRRLDAALRGARGTVFDPLPYTRKEVETIGGLFRSARENHEARLLLGTEASEQTLAQMAESGELGGFRLLHLATHGAMDDKAAMRSALILSQDQLPDSLAQVTEGREVFDGRLTAEQIVRTWHLDADLVTLSGCETALGRESGGEGFLGFSQALFVAGARSLLLSLWRVDDQATMLLMQRFYANLLGSFDQPRSVAGATYGPGAPMPKAEALREAKQWLKTLSPAEAQALLKNSSEAPGGVNSDDKGAAVEHPFKEPRYWAAFILLGDPA
jgi:CHAT domain-containing protein